MPIESPKKPHVLKFTDRCVDYCVEVERIVGIAVGTILEFALKYLFAPAYRRSLLIGPLMMFSFFTESKDIIDGST
ncbi:MAG TPA: hypothetical protein DCX53_01040 [Anaerolineae bacterium]|nr:hypothetical protein [Anaerolineae bacterium]